MANAPKSGKPPATKPAAAKSPAARPAAAKTASPPRPGAPVLDKHPEPQDEAGVAPPAEKRWWKTSKGMIGVAAILIVIVAGGVELWVYLRRPSLEMSQVYDRARDPDILSGGAQAIDGATLSLGGQRVVLQGIRAPHAGAVCRAGGRDTACGEAARDALQKLIGTDPVECVGAGESDGAVLAQCRSDAGEDLAAAQVESGWAIADANRNSRYVPEQSRAESGGRGLWRDDLARPESWR